MISLLVCSRKPVTLYFCTWSAVTGTVVLSQGHLGPLCAADQRLVAPLHMDTGQLVVPLSSDRDRSIMRITPPTQWKLPVIFSNGYRVFLSS
jgi:hypothetical protein